MKSIRIHNRIGQIILSAAVLLSFTIVSAQNSSYDDVYYTPSKNKKEKKEAYHEPLKYVDTTVLRTSREEYQSMTPAAFEDENGDVYTTSKYHGNYTNYSEDDYYDYSYAARIKRFHSPTVVIYDYYDDYYTNLYWYTRDPFYWGVSIYSTYNWWYPSYYHTSWYAGPRWGGYYWSGYWGWGYPYYYSYYNPYYYGYGYYPHYHRHYAHCYYNSFDKHSNYYSSRDSRTGRYTYAGRQTAPTRNDRSFGERYESRYGTPNRNSRNSARETSINSGRGTSSYTRQRGVDIAPAGTDRTSYGQRTSRTEQGNRFVKPETSLSPVRSAAAGSRESGAVRSSADRTNTYSRTSRTESNRSAVPADNGGRSSSAPRTVSPSENRNTYSPSRTSSSGYENSRSDRQSTSPPSYNRSSSSERSPSGSNYNQRSGSSNNSGAARSSSSSSGSSRSSSGSSRR